jgi:hypothetical protein
VIVGYGEEFHDPACQLLAHDTSPVCARDARGSIANDPTVKLRMLLCNMFYVALHQSRIAVHNDRGIWVAT